MNQKARLRRLESAIGSKAREPKSLGEMTDDELAVLITGDVNAKASDLSDEYLAAIAGD